VIAVGLMLAASGPIGEFVERHPTVKMLALAFLLLIGVSLVAEGLHQHIPKGYIYFAMAFAVLVELLNLRVRGRPSHPVELRQSYVEVRPPGDQGTEAGGQADPAVAKDDPLKRSGTEQQAKLAQWSL
jgi:hypothetical protein